MQNLTHLRYNKTTLYKIFIMNFKFTTKNYNYATILNTLLKIIIIVKCEKNHSQQYLKQIIPNSVIKKYYFNKSNNLNYFLTDKKNIIIYFLNHLRFFNKYSDFLTKTPTNFEKCLL